MTELEWGQTPWDNLTKDEILLELCRAYKAVESLYSCMNVMQCANPNSPYWGRGGAGGRAREMGRQVRERVESKFDGENVYRSFFRYATDLLFDRSKFDIGFGWSVCSHCGTMLGETREGQSYTGQKCVDAFGLTKDCPGIFEPLTWTHLDRAEFDFCSMQKEV